MSLNNLLKLQLLYCILGILFNLFSWLMLMQNETPLTPTAPITGIFVMALYGLFLLAGKYRQIGLYQFLMFIAIIVFGYGGILKHILTLNQSPDLYYSLGAGIAAILINVFGFILNGMVVLSLFKMSDGELKTNNIV